ncbi:MAG: BPSL0067 family protein [Methylocella sp.]
MALLTKNNFGDFAPLPQRALETILSAGYKTAVDLGSRMHGLAALAKALNQGDHALAAIVLVQLQFPALPDKGAGARMKKAAAMLDDGAPAAEVLRHLLPNGDLAKFNPYHLGPGPAGGEFTTAEMDATSSGDASPQGYATKLSEDDILDQPQDNLKTLGWLQPTDVKPGNEKECVSLVREVIPKFPHSSQWQEGDPVTPENAGTIPPGTAVATFVNGRYGNAASGNHAAICLGPHVDDDGSTDGIVVVDQSEYFPARAHTLPFDEPASGRGYRAGQFSVIRR